MLLGLSLECSYPLKVIGKLPRFSGFLGTCYGTFFGTVIEIHHISHAGSLFFILKVKAMFSNPNVKGKEATLSKTAPGKYKQQV